MGAVEIWPLSTFIINPRTEMTYKGLVWLIIFFLKPSSGRYTKPTFILPTIRPDPDHPFTISVEGNVGAGKSTLLNFFNRFPEFAVHKEPLDQWQDLSGTNFLELVFSDPARWGLAFESLVTLTMAEIHMADHDGAQGLLFRPVKVMERSITAARKVFIENLRPQLTPGEVEILDAWYNLLVSRPEFDTKVDLIIYLRTSPQVAYERMRSRARSEEASLPLQHFQRLHKLHEEWLMGESQTARPPVIVIDANEDISSLAKTYRKLAKAVWRATNRI